MIPGIFAGQMSQGAGSGDPYWGDVEMLLHFNGTAGSTTFTDSKGLRTLTPFGTAQISATSKFGTGSGSFDASGDYLTVSPVINLSSGDFTIEWWVKFETTLLVNPVLSSRNGAQGYQVFSCYASGLLRVVWQQWAPSTTYEIIDVSVAKTLGSWVAVCIERVGDVVTAYADGVAIGTLTTANRPSTAPTVCHIAQDSGAPGATLNGLIDELRITKRTGGRYGGAYTPSASAFPDY